MMPVLIAIAGRRGEEFAITQHPASVTGQVGDPVLTLSVGYVPVEAAVQWQWSNPTEQGVQKWIDISGATADSYTMIDNGSGLVLAQNDDRYRANVTFDSETITSNEAIITVSLGDVKEMTGKAKDLITPPANHYYNGEKPGAWNDSMESLESSNPAGIFPDGPIPYIGAFDPFGNDYEGTLLVDKAADAGYTVIGPYPHTYSKIDHHFKRIAERGLSVAGCIRNLGRWSGGNAWTQWKNASDAGEMNLVIDRVRSEIDFYNGDPHIGDASPGGSKIAAWFNPLDDGLVDIAASSTYADDYRAYQDATQNYAGTKDLPIGGYGWGNTFTTHQRHNGAYNSCYMAQNFFHGAGCDDDNYDHWYGRMSVTKEAEWYSRVDQEYTSKSGKPRLKMFMPGPFMRWHCPTIPAFQNNPEFTNAEMVYGIITSMMAGMNSFMCYIPRQGYGTECDGNLKSTENALFDLMWDFVSRFTSSNAAQALLWGRGAEPQKYNKEYDPIEFNPEPITESRVSGDVTFKWRNITSTQDNGLPEHNPISTTSTTVYPIFHRDIQFRDERFIFLTNGMPRQEFIDAHNLDTGSGHTDGTIVSRLSGFPSDGTHTQLKVTDILTGTTYNLTGSTLDITIPPTRAIILKVEAADGWIYPQ